jgi:hypothetical protein
MFLEALGSGIGTGWKIGRFFSFTGTVLVRNTWYTWYGKTLESKKQS